MSFEKITPQLRAVVATALAAIVLAGCMNSPRNNQRVSKRNEKVVTQGAVTKGRQQLSLQQFNNRTRRFETVPDGFAVAQSSPFFTDRNGINWFRYDDEATLRSSNDFWRLHSNGSQRVLSTEVRTVDAAGGGALKSYDDGQATNDCIAANHLSGGSAVINNCSSSRSPNARLLLDCGRAGQPCCTASNVSGLQACDHGRTCDGGSHGGRCSIVAGAHGQACNSDLTCDPGVGCRVGDTWTFDFNRLKVLARTEHDWFGPGDEPMLAVIPFRLEAHKVGNLISVDDSIIGWNEVIHRLGTDINGGGSAPLAVSDPNGRVHFSHVDVKTAAEVNAGAPFSIVGAVMVAIEDDSTDRHIIRSFIRDALPGAERALVQGIEGIGANAMMASVDEMELDPGACTTTGGLGFDKLQVIGARFGAGEFLENIFEAALNNTSLVLSAQVRLWLGFGSGAPTVVEHSCNDLDGTKAEIIARLMGETSSTLSTPDLEFRHGRGTNWRGEAQFFNLSDDLWSTGQLTCSANGASPHRLPSGQPQLLTPTTYFASAPTSGDP